jgi:hypothetical protein
VTGELSLNRIIKTETTPALDCTSQQPSTKLKLPSQRLASTVKPESYSHSTPESCQAHRSLVYCAAAAKYRRTVIDLVVEADARYSSLETQQMMTMVVILSLIILEESV